MRPALLTARLVPVPPSSEMPAARAELAEEVALAVRPPVLLLPMLASGPVTAAMDTASATLRLAPVAVALIAPLLARLFPRLLTLLPAPWPPPWGAVAVAVIVPAVVRGPLMRPWALMP